ncbi:disease resistance protein RGA2-like [Panicum virgatum]|uniref:Disease resistance N-terminal domain-containing protein n=1 Tax=Panicum virgatum TaxID=38727 RepID=A0A8T0ST22_PANVG|nr:disease resistance protein RGA2-like [Panicum virgatum]KAG2600348.1 hypothetical protein PVAP13_5KG468100 [Panicum virgatum]
METIVSAVTSDLLSRALSVVIQRCKRPKAEEAEHKLQRLQRVLLRADAMVKEAEGRHIGNQAMLRQLEMLRQAMYRGHYMLDTVKCRGQEGDGEVSSGLPVTLPRFSSARHRLPSFPITSSKKNLKNTMPNTESLNKLEKMRNGLETLMDDMVEFTVFLEGYPRIPRQPYSTYLILDKVMFGRQMEKETIINFLLRTGVAACDESPKVLPIVGAAWVGMTTLIEHVCLDERVREHFSSIVFFTEDDLGAQGMASPLPPDIGVIKHQDLTATSYGRSLSVIELAGDMDEETWSRLYSSAASSMAHGSKIIVASRSEKISGLGTTQEALRLRHLPRDAYWYFFRTLVFGSANHEDQPKLASLAMEIAALTNGTFLGANIMASMMRANLNARFWSRLLQCLRDYTSRHLLMFGEHPADLIQKGRPVYACRMTQQSQISILGGNIYQKGPYQKCSTQNDVSKLTAQDIITGCVTHEGKFTALTWRSTIPPYYTYFVNCESQKAGCSTIGKKRPRQARF